MDTIWLTRQDIGLIAPNRQSVVRETTSGIFFHHSGTAKPSAPKSVDESTAQWRNIQLDHLSRVIFDKNGNPTYWSDGTVRLWADIAYNIGIGYRCVLDGRGLQYQSGGTGWPWDGYTVSICVLGNMTIEDLTADQEETIIFALRRIREIYGNNLSINGDRDVNSTNCPGDHLYAKIDELWERSGNVAPTPLPVPPAEPEEDEDMGKPLYRIRSEDPYEAWLVRWDNGKLSHLSPAENASPTYNGLPTYEEDDRESYKRLVAESGTTWQPSH